jgi:hypothetical protein
MNDIRIRARAAIALSAFACILSLALPVSRIDAQQSAPVALSLRAATSMRDSITTPANWDGWQWAHCMAGITYGAPLKWAASYGGGLRREYDDAPDVCVMGVGKVGIGGAQASLGVGASLGALGGGVMVSGNLLRTFSTPLHATARRTYVGASLHLWPIIAFGGEIGYYTRLGDAAGAASGGKHLVAWSTGFGF